MLMAIRERLARIAPDIVATLKRFPHASALLGLATVLTLLLANEVVGYDNSEPWLRLWMGLLTAALLATAGVLFGEARGRWGIIENLLVYLPALAVIGLFQVTDTRFALPWLLPAAALAWLSISLSVGARGDSAYKQDFFWWSNHRAATTALIACAAGAVILFGLFAIYWSLELLFHIDLSEVFANWLLPVTLVLLIPLYWLSTLPHPDEFSAGTLSASDFLMRAIGFMGPFVFILFTLAYALILHAYALQIALAGSLPEGRLAWMVIYFLSAGLGTWLLVHPAFVREKPLVKLFRTVWFPLSVVPLILLGMATWVRIDAYGLTPARVALAVAGLWALAVTLVFLVRRGNADIRLMPGLAGILIALMAIGPLNPENLSRWQQMARLETLLAEGLGPEGPAWTTEQRRAVRAAYDHLLSDSYAQDDLRALLTRAGIEEAASGSLHAPAIRAALGIDLTLAETEDGNVSYQLAANFAATPTFLAQTPYLIGALQIGQGPGRALLGEYAFVADESALTVLRGDDEVGGLELGEWLVRQANATAVAEPVLALTLEGQALALVVRQINFMEWTEEGVRRARIRNLDTLVFSDRPELTASP